MGSARGVLMSTIINDVSGGRVLRRPGAVVRVVSRPVAR